MRVSYMGIFKIIFNAIFEAILSPIIKFIAKLLSPVISWVFNTILKPILVVVFKWVIPWVADLLKNIFAGILYAIFAYLVKILEYFEKAIDYFAGISKVGISYGTVLNKSQCTLLEAFLYRNEISTIFKTIFVLGFAMSLIFSIIAIVKSSLDVDFENKRPVNAVLKSTMRAFLQFLLTNLMVMFIISLSSVILDVINDSFNNLYVDAESAKDYENNENVDNSGNIKSYKTSLARVVFCSCTLQAAKDPNININDYNTTGKVSTIYKGMKQIDYDPLIAGARGEYYNINSSIDITNVDQAKQYFYLEKIDYFLGAVLTIFLIAIMALCAITFIQRIFDIIILYIVSPYFVSTIPLDDGEKYKKWKSLFIGKVFSGYGTIISMKIYLLLVPMIVGNNIQFSNDSISGVSSGTSIYMLKMIFLIGGAWATLKIGAMITNIIDAGAGQAEAETQRMVSGYTGKAVSAGVSFATSAALSTAAFTGKMLTKPIRNAGSKLFGKGGKEVADKKWNDMQDKMLKEFPGKNGDAKGKDNNGGTSSGGNDTSEGLNIGGGIDNKSGSLGGDKSGGGKDNKSGGGGDNKSGSLEGDKKTDNATSGKSGEGSGISGNKSIGQDSNKLSNDKSKSGNKEGSSNKFNGKAKDKSSSSDDLHPFLFDGKAKKQNFFDKAVKKVHDIMPQKRNPDGSYSWSLLGFKINYDKDGNRKSISTPFRKLKYDKDGKLHTTKIKIPGIYSVKRNTKTGKFCLSSIPAFGVKRKQGRDGEFHLTKFSPLGINRVEDLKGEYHMTSIMGIDKGLRYNKETDSYETCGIRIGNMIWGAEEYLNNDSEDTDNTNESRKEINIGNTNTLGDDNQSGSIINENANTGSLSINNNSTLVNKNKSLKTVNTVAGTIHNNKKSKSTSISGGTSNLDQRLNNTTITDTNEDINNVTDNNIIDSDVDIETNSIDTVINEVNTDYLSDNVSTVQSSGSNMTNIGKKRGTTLTSKGTLGKSNVINNTTSKVSLKNINTNLNNTNSIVNDKQTIDLNSNKVGLNNLNANNSNINNLKLNNSISEKNNNKDTE